MLSKNSNRILRLAASGFAMSFASAALAQTSAPTGLGSLTDEKVMADLANRGLTVLLDRAFDINQVPPAQRNALRSLVSMRELTNPAARLSTAQRQEMAKQAAAGIEAALPSLNDPQILKQQATALLDAGVNREVKILEYWGENPKTQAAVKPVAQAVIKLLDKASALAKQQSDALSNAITGPDDPRGKQWETLASLATETAYTRNIVAYNLAIALDRSDSQRKEIAGKAIEFLAQYDTSDSNVQPTVRLYLGKLRLARGEYDEAKKIFATLVDGKEITPPPDVSQQWEARYSIALTDFLSGDVEASQKALAALIDWQAANLPKDKSAQDGAAAVTSMLQYRIAAQQKDNAKAIAILVELVKKRPDLQSMIFEQLMSKLPADTDLKTIDPLLLQGYVVAADQERLKPDDQPADPKVLQHGLDAIAEMQRKSAQIDPQLLDSASLVRGFILERLGQHVDAGNALLDYATRKGATPQNQQIALDNAMVIIAKLRSNPVGADAPDVVRLYERFLPIAIAPPFSRAEFSYEYARRLQLAGKLEPAVEYFRKVPTDDKRYVFARFYQLAALRDRLDDEKLPAPQRQQIVGEISDLMDDVVARLKAALATATDEKEKQQYRSRLASAVLLAADISRREKNDARHTLALLDGFESVAAGLPDEKELLGAALYTRVQAYVTIGDSNAATQTLVELLKKRPGGEGANIVYKLLEKLNNELDHARRAGDMVRVRTLAKNRAQLSGFLVEWARNNADPRIQKFTYRYSVFDAATKHLAAELEEDPAKQKAGLQDALKLYQQLESPASAELYKATLDPKSADPTYPDPAVSLGIGLISFDLGDFATAQARLGKLLNDRKLGSPTIATEENGQTKLLENDSYWEATLDLMRSNVALALAHPEDANAQSAKQETTGYLKQLYVRYGRDVGGRKWSPEFEKLRQQIAPDLNPDDFSVQATTQPTTAP